MKMRRIIFPLITAILYCGSGIPLRARSAENPVEQPLRYEIWVKLDHPQRMLRGREEISWTNTSRDAVPDMLFHLYTNAFKNENSTVMQESREESLFIRARVKEGEWGWVARNT